METKIYDMVARIDERVKFLVESNSDVREQVDDLLNRVSLIEVEVKSSSHKWKLLFDACFKIGVTVIGALIVYKLGI